MKPDCGCARDDNGVFTPVCAFHLCDWSAHVSPNAGPVFTPKNETELNAAFSRAVAGVWKANLAEYLAGQAA